MTQVPKSQVFVFLSFHHTNNRVEIISNFHLFFSKFYVPLFKSETEKLFLADKILKRHYPPLPPPLVTPMVITQSGACPLSGRRMKSQSTVTTKRLLTSPRVTRDGSDTRRHSPVLLSRVDTHQISLLWVSLPPYLFMLLCCDK